MNDVFLKLFNMSMTAVLIILAVILLRLLFKKAPKWISCLLWALVAVRLLCPVTFETEWSLVPSAEPVKINASPYVDSGVELIDSVANELIGSPKGARTAATPTPAIAQARTQMMITIVTAVWLTGVAAFAIYGTVSYIRLKKKLAASVETSDGIRISDDIDCPFIMGIIRPVIYLPSGLDEKTMEYVLKHEKAHLARRDHWWKPLGFTLLALHWFNPFCWAAYILFSRDIELACDERAVRQMGKADKIGYSKSLLELSYPGNLVSACPVAFAEIGVKERVKSVLNYKKPAFWLIATGLVCCAVLSVLLLTNPRQAKAVVDSSDVKIKAAVTDPADNKDPEETKATEETKSTAVTEGEQQPYKEPPVTEGEQQPYKDPPKTDAAASANDVVSMDVVFEGDIDKDGSKDRIEVNRYTDEGAGEWYLILNDDQIYSGKLALVTDFDIWYTDLDKDDAEEIIVVKYPHVNSMPLTEYVVLKKSSGSWVELENSDDFGMTDENGDPCNSFPIRVSVGSDRDEGIVSIDNTDIKITFDLKDHYKQLEENENGNDLDKIAKGYLKGVKFSSGDKIGGPCDWGVWDVKAAKADGQKCLIARQGLCGTEGGKFDYFGTIDIYFNYTEDGKINIIKTDFTTNWE